MSSARTVTSSALRFITPKVVAPRVDLVARQQLPRPTAVPQLRSFTSSRICFEQSLNPVDGKPYKGRCNCGSVSWTVTGKVDFRSVCHCKNCQRNTGNAAGTTSLMIYDPHGVKFEGEAPKRFDSTSERGKTTSRGFCGNCGSVLFNHVSKGNDDEHWAMRIGALEGPPPPPEKEIFMKEKPEWVLSPDGTEQYEAMPGH